MFELFTNRARVINARANQIATEAGSSHIGPEHMLLALIKLGKADEKWRGIGYHAILKLADMDAVEKSLTELMPKAGKTIIERPDQTNPANIFAKTVIERAIQESRDLGTNHVGSEHLLLAMLSLGDSLSALALNENGITYVGARQKIAALLGIELPKPTTKKSTAKPPRKKGRDSR